MFVFIGTVLAVVVVALLALVVALLFCLSRVLRELNEGFGE